MKKYLLIPLSLLVLLGAGCEVEPSMQEQGIEACLNSGGIPNFEAYPKNYGTFFSACTFPPTP